MLLLDVSTTQGPELHLDIPRQQEPVLLLDVSTPQGLELHWDVPRLQEPVLLLDFTVSTLKRHVLTCMCLHHRGLSRTWACLHYRCLCCNWTCLHPAGGLSCNWIFHLAMWGARVHGV
jgi:hypothetical protein